ncbi:DUF3450 domain-containing protein [Shewanella chilikensis]|uniref:DUF3450 domain-containing protein n=1 Tax=Shewanella chilikensis TaxID=558541 RepID=UPI001F29A019|nr:DUF3450 domain-containing protein [Shewanella chilikensis]MCE9787773.1 DUF3450 domain-containing protein [Shewanella chilikensis]
MFTKTAVSVLAAWVLQVTATPSDLNEIHKADRQGLKASQHAQQVIEKLDDEQQSLIQENRQLKHEIQLASHYQKQLQQQIGQLHSALEELGEQRRQLRQTRMQLAPMMDEMLLSLTQLVRADLPFQQQERQQRLDNLQLLLQSAELNQGEKLTRLLDAYQVELSYGYSVESWQGKLGDGRLVNFLRAGRLGYFFLTLDGKAGGRWQGDSWQALTPEQLGNVAAAIRVASGESIPALLQLPLIMEAS